MNVRSEALFTFGTTIVSRLGDWRMDVRSSRARPVDTAFIRTESSDMEGGLGVVVRKLERVLRAWGFCEGVTLSSRS